MESIGFVWLHRGHWGLITVAYLFFAGLGGGAYLAGLAAVGLGGPGERRVRLEFARWGFLVALVAVAIAGVAIISHLANPLAGLLFPVTLTNLGSWITRGTWILVSLGLFTALHALWFHFGELGAEGDGASTFVRATAERVGIRGPLDRLANASRPSGAGFWVVAAFGALPALGTIYTGFELAAVTTVPLWSQPTLLPALFLVNGAAAGFAAVLAVTAAFEGAASRTALRFAGAVGGLLALSGALLYAFWRAVPTGPAGAESLTMLSTGPLGYALGLVLVGLAVPIVAAPVFAWLGQGSPDGRPHRAIRSGLVGALALAVMSSFLLRYALVFAAVKHPIVVVGV